MVYDDPTVVCFRLHFLIVTLTVYTIEDRRLIFSCLRKHIRAFKRLNKTMTHRLEFRDSRLSVYLYGSRELNGQSCTRSKLVSDRIQFNKYANRQSASNHWTAHVHKFV